MGALPCSSEEAKVRRNGHEKINKMLADAFCDLLAQRLDETNTGAREGGNRARDDEPVGHPSTHNVLLA